MTDHVNQRDALALLRAARPHAGPQPVPDRLMEVTLAQILTTDAEMPDEATMVITGEHPRWIRWNDELAPQDSATVQPAIPATRNGSRTRHRSRPLITALVAASTVAVIAAVGAVAAGTFDREPATAGPAAAGPSAGFDIAYTYRVTPVPGLVVAQRDLYADRQSVIFSRRTPGTSGVAYVQTARVDVYQPGQYDPGPAQRGTPVTVAGRPGFFTPLSVQLHDDVPNSRHVVPAIAWNYAPDAWAVAAGMDADTQTLDVETTLAQAIVPGTNPVLLPAKLTALPAGLTRSHVWIQTDVFDNGLASFSIGFTRADTGSVPGRDSDFDYTVTMQINPPGSADPSGTAQPTPLPSPTDPIPQATFTRNGQAYTISTITQADGTTMYVNSPNGRLSVMLSSATRLTRSPDLRWADFEPAKSFTDQGTWFNADSAIP